MARGAIRGTHRGSAPEITIRFAGDAFTARRVLAHRRAVRVSVGTMHPNSVDPPGKLATTRSYSTITDMNSPLWR